MKLRDITGQRFGKLVAEARAHNIDGRVSWSCKCDCGKTRVVPTRSLTSGCTRSCGCIRRNRAAGLNKTHGMTASREYNTWRTMRSRCTNPRDIGYPNYGGRGISIHPAWRASFEAFLRDVGACPSRNHSLDRIDNDGNYQPGNVRWATSTEQCRNKRTNTVISHNGLTMCVAEWAERIGADRDVVYARIKSGWDAWAALVTPVVPAAKRRSVNHATLFP